jgi:hypothetical protein
MVKRHDVLVGPRLGKPEIPTPPQSIPDTAHSSFLLGSTHTRFPLLLLFLPPSQLDHFSYYCVMLTAVAVLPEPTPLPPTSAPSPSAGDGVTVIIAAAAAASAAVAVAVAIGLFFQGRRWRERARVEALRAKGLLGVYRGRVGNGCVCRGSVQLGWLKDGVLEGWEGGIGLNRATSALVGKNLLGRRCAPTFDHASQNKYCSR